MRKGIVISLAVLLVVFLAIGCTDTGTDEGTDDTGVVPPEENETMDEPVDDQAMDNQTVEDDTTDNQTDEDVVDTVEVEVNEDGFNPETVSVMIGDTVTWINTGQESVTITGDNEGISGMIGPGETFSYTFDASGTYEYFSEEDPSMTGTVNVGVGPADNQTSTTGDQNTTSQGDIIVESDQPSTNTTITPDEEDNNTL